MKIPEKLAEGVAGRGVGTMRDQGRNHSDAREVSADASFAVQKTARSRINVGEWLHIPPAVSFGMSLGAVVGRRAR